MLAGKDKSGGGNPMTKLRKFTFPILIGILLLVLAACGGDDESETASQPAAGSQSKSELVSEGLSFKFQYACIRRRQPKQVRTRFRGSQFQVPIRLYQQDP